MVISKFFSIFIINCAYSKNEYKVKCLDYKKNYSLWGDYIENTPQGTKTVLRID